MNTRRYSLLAAGILVLALAVLGAIVVFTLVQQPPIPTLAPVTIMP